MIEEEFGGGDGKRFGDPKYRVTERRKVPLNLHLLFVSCSESSTFGLNFYAMSEN